MSSHCSHTAASATVAEFSWNTAKANQGRRVEKSVGVAVARALKLSDLERAQLLHDVDPEWYDVDNRIRVRDLAFRKPVERLDIKRTVRARDLNIIEVPDSKRVVRVCSARYGELLQFRYWKNARVEAIALLREKGFQVS